MAAVAASQKLASDENSIHVLLEAALYWLSDNPILPSIKQLNEIFTKVDRGNGGTYIPAYLEEWQRRMFLAPEPDVPEEIKDLLRQDGSVTYVVSEHNTAVLMAYHRGCNSKKG